MEVHGSPCKNGGNAMELKVAALEKLLIEECLLAEREKTWTAEKWQDLVDKVLTRFSDSGPHTLRGKLAYAIAIIGSENREFFYLAFKDLCDWAPIGGPYWVVQEEILRHHILFFIAKGVMPVSIDLFGNGDDTSTEDMVDLEEAKKVIQKVLSDVKTASIPHKILKERMIELRSEFLKLVDALESVTSMKEAHDLLHRVDKKFPLKHFVNLFMEWAQTILVNTVPLQNQNVHKMVASPIPCRPPVRAFATSSSTAQQTKMIPSSPITQDLPEDTSMEDDVIDDKATDDLRDEGDTSPYHRDDDRGDTMDDFGEPFKPSHSPVKSATNLANGDRESVNSNADATSPPTAAAAATAAVGVTRMRGMKRSFERVDYPELDTHPDEQQQPSQPQQPQPQQQESDQQQAQDRAMMQILSEVMYQPPASPGAVPLPAVSQPSFASPSAAAAAASAAAADAAAVPVDPSTQLETDKDETECGSELTNSPSSKSSTTTVEVRYYVSPSDLHNGAPEEDDDDDDDDGGVQDRENGGILTPWKTICRLFSS